MASTDYYTLKVRAYPANGVILHQYEVGTFESTDQRIIDLLADGTLIELGSTAIVEAVRKRYVAHAGRHGWDGAKV
jgi:hypothetical protein